MDAYRKRSGDDFLLFINGLVIPSASGPKQFSDCLEPFQLEFFEAIAPSLYALRDGKMPPIRRWWMERTKKAGKDSDLACIVTWLIGFARRPFKCQICAENRKQAAILRNRTIELIHYNPWVQERVEVIESDIRSRKMKRQVWAHIESTDTGGAAQGETPDLLILNELVHVSKWSVMETHMNNADGVPQGIVIISTNAGIKGTRAEAWRSLAINNPKRWGVYIWNEQSPWVSEKDVEEARKRDPVGSEFERLWRGKWVSGVGNAVSEEDIARCFRDDLEPQVAAEPGLIYVAGLDLGVSHDHAGLVVLGVDTIERRIRVVHLESWMPNHLTGGKLEVDLMAVERKCGWVHSTFAPIWFGYDPAAGGSFMAQRLRLGGAPMCEFKFSSASSLTLMATTFVKTMKAGMLNSFESAELRRDFGKFCIEHRPPSNYKLTAVSDEFGHADVGTALVICLPRAIDLLGGWVVDDMHLVAEDDSPLSEEEIAEMPEDLREIYDGAIEDEREWRSQLSGW